jgi:hypothetical protein
MTGWIDGNLQNQNEGLHETLFPHGAIQIAQFPDRVRQRKYSDGSCACVRNEPDFPLVASNVGI